MMPSSCASSVSRSPARSPTSTAVLQSNAPSCVQVGGGGSLLVAFAMHWLPYATQSRQTFLLYYLPAYYFAILLAGRVWHHVVCMTLPRALSVALTLCVGGGIGYVSYCICLGQS